MRFCLTVLVRFPEHQANVNMQDADMDRDPRYASKEQDVCWVVSPNWQGEYLMYVQRVDDRFCFWSYHSTQTSSSKCGTLVLKMYHLSSLVHLRIGTWVNWFGRHQITTRHRQKMLQDWMDCCLYTTVTLHKPLETSHNSNVGSHSRQVETSRRPLSKFWAGQETPDQHRTALHYAAAPGVLNCVAGCVGHEMGLFGPFNMTGEVWNSMSVMPSGMRDMVWTLCAGTVGPKAAVGISWCHVEKCTTPPRMLFIV